MILGFNKRFPKPIHDKIKIHTIREDRYNRWKVGRIIHMATGVRTKLYKCFYRCKCTGTQSIHIFYKDEQTFVRVDDKPLTRKQVVVLALNDGFNSIDDFFAWFNKDFSGKIIHWTDFRY